MKNTEIYYFSGSGNSLYIAKEIQQRIPGSILIPMVSLLNQDTIKTNGETVGFVFPIHLMTFPIPVTDFFSKVDVHSADYLFAVTTLTGTPHFVEISIDNALKKQDKQLDAYFQIVMPSASPVSTMPVDLSDWFGGWPPKEEIVDQKNSDAQKKLDLIQKTIVSKEQNAKDDSPGFLRRSLKRLTSILMAPLSSTNMNTTMHFYVDSSCTGCGICEKVCPSQRITMVNGKPVWQETVPCYLCQGCFAYCPSQSILVEKIYEKKPGRYHHPQVTANEIAGQT